MRWLAVLLLALLPSLAGAHELQSVALWLDEEPEGVVAATRTSVKPPPASVRIKRAGPACAPRGGAVD